jgi:hypothetical protein
MAKSTDWIRASARLDRSQPAACPNCGSSPLRSRKIADPATRVGYALVWCETCREGARISRIVVPADADFIHVGSPEAAATLPPDLRFVDE